MQPEPSIIELHVEKVGRLFDTLDPMPFREKDLDRAVEDYIVVYMFAAEASGPMRRYCSKRWDGI